MEEEGVDALAGARGTPTPALAPTTTPSPTPTPTPSSAYVTPGMSRVASSPGAGPGPATEASRRRSASRASTRTATPIDAAGDVSASDGDSGADSDAETFASASHDNLFDEEEDYERQRLKRMMENQSILASLQLDGGASGLMPFERSLSPGPASQRPRPRGRPKQYLERRDRAGYIVSLPAPGQRHVLAAVEVDTNRATRRAIDAGEYVDCTAWAAGEARRWRFGDGEGTLADDEAPVVGDVGPDFRWKEFDWSVFDDSPAFSPDPSPGVEPYEPQPRQPKKHHSEYEGGACHQCKRRSDKPKMQCRNVDPECTQLFCISCCKRYDYFEFDEESRSFICPLCMGICNCSRCLRRRNLGHLAGGKFGRGFGRFAGAEAALEDYVEGETVQHYLERVGKKEPDFDRVRLVDAADDIVSPPLPQEWQEYLEKKRREALGISRDLHPKPKNPGGKTKEVDANGTPIKRKRKPGPKVKKGKTGPNEGDNDDSDVPLAKKQRASMPNGDDAAVAPRITLRVTVPPPRREKQVDSDGDTVDDTSSDDDESVAASEASAGVGDLGAAPGNMNDYLARMAAAVVPTLPHLDMAGHFDESEPLHEPLDMEVEMGLDGMVQELAGKEYDDFGSAVDEFERMERTLSGDFGLGDGLLPPLEGFGPHRPLFGPALPHYSPTLPSLPMDATLSPAVGAASMRDTPPADDQGRGRPSLSPRTPSRLRASPNPLTPGLGLSLSSRFTIPDLSPGNDPLPAVYPPYPDLDIRLPAYPGDEPRGEARPSGTGTCGQESNGPSNPTPTPGDRSAEALINGHHAGSVANGTNKGEEEEDAGSSTAVEPTVESTESVRAPSTDEHATPTDTASQIHTPDAPAPGDATPRHHSNASTHHSCPPKPIPDAVEHPPVDQRA